MGAMPVVAVKPDGQFGVLIGCVVGSRIGPLAHAGLDEALGLSVGLGGVGVGSQVLDPEPAVLCVKFCKGGHGRAGLGGLAEVGFLVLLKIVHVEVAVGFEPVFVGLDG